MKFIQYALFLINVHNHLVSLKLKQHYQETEGWNEKLFIQNRMGNKFMTGDKISGFHR